MADEPVKPWRWPGQWVKDEKFWREVGSRTLSAVFAAFILYMGAVAAGIVASPPFLRVLIGLGLVVISTLISMVLVRWYVRRQGKRPVDEGSWGRFFVEMLGGLTVGLVVFFITLSAYRFLADRIDWLGDLGDFYQRP